jgi:hypothetical protein
MIRIALPALAFLSLAACQLNWQETYNNAARNDCRQVVDADARRACLDRVEDNASARRAEGRT